MLESFRKNKKGILLMLISSICVCVGQLLWKLSATQGIIIMLSGFCFYGLGAVVMIIAYKFGKLSVLQPMLSLNYVLSLILGYCSLVFQTLVRSLKFKFFIFTVFSYPEGCLWTAYPDFLFPFSRQNRYPHLTVSFMSASLQMWISFLLDL